MNLNDDPSKRVVLRSAELPWQFSPVAGVERRLLARDGGEDARATSIVRYLPGAAFPSHAHPQGEEMVVSMGSSRMSTVSTLLALTSRIRPDLGVPEKCRRMHAVCQTPSPG